MDSLTFPSFTATNIQTTDSQKSSSNSSSLLTGEFKNMLSSMMGMGSSSAGGDSSSAMGQLSSMMVLIPLIERLIDLAMELDKDPEASAASTTATSAASAQSIHSSATPQGRPCEGVITQTFHPGHNGIDFGVPIGTPIQTTMDGHVTYSGWNNEGYGNLVIVENGPYKTYYAHLNEVQVKIGDTIQAGSVVGLSGTTGNSTGPHLHYEVRENGAVIDPSGFTLN